MVNIGWLAQGHEYACGVVNQELALALAKLAKRPTNLYHGLHECEFCPANSAAHGTGEIRLTVDSTTYAAPTLVAHYVSVHGYEPPAAFVEAAIAAGNALVELDKVEHEVLTAMTPKQRFEICLSILAELSRRPVADPLLCEAHRGLVAVVPFIEAESRGEVDGALRAVAVALGRSESTELAIATLTKEVGELVFGATRDASLGPAIETVERARELGVSIDLEPASAGPTPEARCKPL